MSPAPLNSPIGKHVPARLRALRLARGLSRQELADLSGLSERSVRDIENGHRIKTQEKTLILLAQALGCNLSELVGDPPSAQSKNEGNSREPAHRNQFTIKKRKIWNWFFPLALLALLLGWHAIDHMEWEIIDGDLVMWDGLFHRALWRISENPEVKMVSDSPWGPFSLLVGFTGHAHDDAQLWRINSLTGKKIASFSMNQQLVRQAFGDEVLAEGPGFYCNFFQTLDVDGDGIMELAVVFTHGMWYPTGIGLFSANGEELGFYANRGHISQLHVEDLDGDGCDELLALGTNNDPAYNGATVIYLEKGAWSGAAVDPPGSKGKQAVGAICDGARYRLVLPSFGPSIMDDLGEVRLSARGARVKRGRNGATRIMFTVGTLKGPGVIVVCDNKLHPQSVHITDALVSLVHKLPEQTDTDLILSPEFLDQWLQEARWSSLDSPYLVLGSAGQSGKMRK